MRSNFPSISLSLKQKREKNHSESYGFLFIVETPFFRLFRLSIYLVGLLSMFVIKYIFCIGHSFVSNKLPQNFKYLQFQNTSMLLGIEPRSTY
jgi:hypothetical protein